MKCLVTYASKNGSTKKYAQWIAEALACDIQDSKDVNRKLLECEEDVLTYALFPSIAPKFLEEKRRKAANCVSYTIEICE